jgi:hypothetical protein
MTLVFFLMWMIEVLLFQNIDNMVSWNDSDQSTFLVNNWESVMVIFLIFKYLFNVLNCFNWSEDIDLSFHHVISF